MNTDKNDQLELERERLSKRRSEAIETISAAILCLGLVAVLVYMAQYGLHKEHRTLFTSVAIGAAFAGFKVI